VRRFRLSSLLRETLDDDAAVDIRAVNSGRTRTPGSAGKTVTDRYKRQVLRDYIVSSARPTGAKDIRARPVAAAAESGLISIVRSRHT
jgi:phage terminase large subunit-like protein